MTNNFGLTPPIQELDVGPYAYVDTDVMEMLDIWILLYMTSTVHALHV